MQAGGDEVAGAFDLELGIAALDALELNAPGGFEQLAIDVLPARLCSLEPPGERRDFMRERVRGGPPLGRARREGLELRRLFLLPFFETLALQPFAFLDATDRVVGGEAGEPLLFHGGAHRGEPELRGVGGFAGGDHFSGIMVQHEEAAEQEERNEQRECFHGAREFWIRGAVTRPGDVPGNARRGERAT